MPELKNTLYIFLYDGRKRCTSCPKEGEGGGRGNSGNARKKTFIFMGGVPLYLFSTATDSIILHCTCWSAPTEFCLLFYCRPKSCFGGLIEQSGYLVLVKLPQLVIKGHFWCFFGSLWSPRGPLKRAQGGRPWHIIM